MKSKRGVIKFWTVAEEKHLIGLMNKARIVREEEVPVPGWQKLMPFAKTIAEGRIGKHRGPRSIAEKVRRLLRNGPTANKRTGADGLLGVRSYSDKRSPPSSLHALVCWPALRRRGQLPPSPACDDPVACTAQVEGASSDFRQNATPWQLRHRPRGRPGVRQVCPPAPAPPLPDSALLCPSEPTGAVAQDGPC